MEMGVWFRRRTIIPLERIQNINVVQGPLMRVYGVKAIQIETAGGAAYHQGPTGSGLSEGQIPAPEDPDGLAEEIMRRVRAAKSGGGV